MSTLIAAALIVWLGFMNVSLVNDLQQCRPEKKPTPATYQPLRKVT